MNIIEIISIFFIIVLLIFWWMKKESRKKISNFYKSIPGPPGLAFFGNALELRSKETVLSVLHKYQNIYGGIFKIKVGPFIQTTMVSDYNFLQQVLNNPKLIEKAHFYNYLRPWLGNGLLLSSGNDWKKHRKVVTPAFHFQILEQFLSAFESHGDIFLEKLNKVDGKEIEIYSLLHLLTLDIICDSSMGSSVNAQLDEDCEYLKSVKQITKIVMDRAFNLIHRNNILFKLTKTYRIQNNAIKVMDNFANYFIKKKRNELKDPNSNIYYNNDENDIIKKKRPFLDILLQSSNFNNEEIKNEVDTIMFGGHDTTGTTLSFVIYCLSKNPDIQQNVFNEQIEIFENDLNASVNYENLQKMKYLEAVIKETLRLYPAAPLFGRHVNEDTVVGDKIIPKGINFIVLVYSIHRNPKYYPEPEKFNPDRFLNNIDKIYPFAYIPFSAGPRNCIGQKYAMLLMKTILSKLIRKFQLLKSDDPLILSNELVLKTKNGIKVGIKKRNPRN